MEIFGELFDYFCPPSFLSLPFQNRAPDLPIKEDQFLVDGESCPNLSSADAFFEVTQEVIVLRQGGEMFASAWLAER
ncbi:hypothetical protein MiSe_10160 [Microseira wollei NIES-4236]|uniref:Uncharacterized protein n=1 Tax=Microseira wollei NIES-4236 TaxID=2530354 RepID=A0AAV3X4N9_9CYAN|nr:hypothetical protein [Microseira wollei]GET36268.1 hypothetical protein MiSe_10160 [Microseira wollei NIES-4236]